MNTKEVRPKLKIPLQPLDWTLEIVGVILLLFFLGLSLYYYNQLPEMIPSHFNAKGEPDQYSAKSSAFWDMPIVATVLYIGILIISQYPHLPFFNYSDVTEENAAHKYRVMVRFLRFFRIAIVTLLLVIHIGTIMTALGHAEGLGEYSILIFMGAHAMLMPFLIYFLARASES